ncbi:MAG TPA: phospholipase D family protein [Thermodesulfobacteriota bacterium]|nr:phospholipase D family protein [Thermodesulfobacteriota bacterium]
MPAATARLFGVLLLSCLGGACASLPADYPRTESHAWNNPGETPLGRQAAAQAAGHPGESGFYLLPSGLDAFAARVLLTEAARKTIDAQYYVFHADFTGKFFLGRLLAAADRGVRVRLLIDDMYTAGKDRTIAALSLHPNFQVRVFNPFAGRSAFSRVFDWFSDFSRVNRRMHNKMFVVDGAAGIAGGRNVGDEYFAAREDANFGDLDLFAIGPVVDELGAAFDEFWNSASAYPIEAFVPEKPAAAELEGISRALEAHTEAGRGSPYAVRVRESDLLTHLGSGGLPLHWGRARVVHDPPGKAAGSPAVPDEETWWGSLRRETGEIRSEVILMSPYFVPGNAAVRRMGEMRKQGVRIRILTNSLASNDVPVVHFGYRKYREPMLREGVELYETRAVLKPAGEKREDTLRRFGSSGARLHAKSLVFDRRSVFVGSANLDPRSLRINTEMGIVVSSPGLAAQVAEVFQTVTDPQYSFRLALQEGKIVWTTREDGNEVVYREEPLATGWGKFSAWIQSLISPESLL